MIFEIVKGDLFTANNEYYLAHCISADYAMGAGIAKPMNKNTIYEKLYTESEIINSQIVF